MAYQQHNSPFNKNSLKKVVTQLNKASKMHASQADIIEDYIDNSSPIQISDKAYEKSNRKMRADHKKETGKTLGKRLTSGKSKRRVSFACRFAGMKGPMKKPNGKPTRKAKALEKWGFGSVAAARSFCNNNKEK